MTLLKKSWLHRFARSPRKLKEAKQARNNTIWMKAPKGKAHLLNLDTMTFYCQTRYREDIYKEYSTDQKAEEFCKTCSGRK